MAFLALRNAIRLHFDSVLLFKKNSFASSLHIAILALEELGKAQELNHYYWSSKVNSGLLPPKYEEKYLKLYYSHQWKQGAAIKRNMFNYSPTFISLIDEKKLERKKQNSVYVGLPLKKGKIDYTSRIKTPFSIKQSEPKKIISINNDILLEMCFYNLAQDGFFDVDGMDNLINKKLQNKLKRNWTYKSGIKSRKWEKVWSDKLSEKKTVE
jgi:AbiV family abortive infection protein